MANKKVTELPTNTSPSGSEIYAVEGGADYRLPIGGNNGISFLGATGLVPLANLGTGAPDGTKYLRGDGTWAAVAGGAGTVTSVSVSTSTGLSVTGSPITSSGTFALALSANLQGWSALATSAKANTSHTHGVSDFTATGTRDSTTFLRGDNTWAVPPGGGGGSGTVTSVNIASATGISWSGGPITSSGTITPTLSANLQNWSALTTGSKADISHTHPASDIVSGILSTARLGTGTANSTVYLRGDGTWQAPPGGGGGTVNSVTLSGSTGLTVGGTNPITSSGTISLTLSATLQSWSGIDPTAKANTSHTHAASDITTGVLGTARLGTGTANSTVYLRGDGTWAAPPGGGGGVGTVTSVAAADATGITWSGSPVTSSGTLTPTLSANLQSWHSLAPSLKADVASPAFTGNPTAPTPLTADNDTSIATTAFVKAQGYTASSGTVTSVSGSGGSTGLSLTGGAITSSGTLTLGGTLAVSNGGTGMNSVTYGNFIFGAGTNQMGERTPAQVLVDIGGLASSSYTAGDVISKVLTVDGSGSGLDADLLDGQHGAYYASASSLGSYATTASLGSYATTASLASYAPLASPAFTGTPTIRNADGTGDTRITRVFVQSGDPGADAGEQDVWLW